MSVQQLSTSSREKGIRVWLLPRNAACLWFLVHPPALEIWGEISYTTAKRILYIINLSYFLNIATLSHKKEPPLLLNEKVNLQTCSTQSQHTILLLPVENNC